jgi:hypothetical protein
MSVAEFRPDPNNPAAQIPYVWNDGVLVPVAFAPFPGSQTAFLQCPEDEVLYAGARAPGKTWALLADFAQGVGQGFGAGWRGLLIRRTMDRHREIIQIGNELFPKIFPGVSFNIMRSYWDFPDGARLILGSIDNEQDYYRFHGSSYPWLGVDEITEFEKPDLYIRLISLTGRITGMPSRVRCTANAYMAGQIWVRDRFHIMQMRDGEIIGPLVQEVDDNGHKLPSRRCIKGYIQENLLISSDYIQKLSAAATCDAERRAWILNDWSVSPGSPLGDLWADYKNEIMVPRFLNDQVPETWRLFNSFDWGSAKPAAALWFAVSDGSDVAFADGTKRNTLKGDTYIVSEKYFWTGKKDTGQRLSPLELANGILAHEQLRGYKKIHGRVADTSIWADSDGRGVSIYSDMLRAGVSFEPANKKPGSRMQAMEKIRSLMKGAHCPKGGAREERGLFLLADFCQQWLRTVPTLPADPTNIGDVLTSAEDHLYDSLAYHVLTDLSPAMTSRRIPDTAYGRPRGRRAIM